MKASKTQAIAYIKDVAGVDVAGLKVSNRAGTETYIPRIHFVVKNPLLLSVGVRRQISRKLGVKPHLIRRGKDFSYSWEVPGTNGEGVLYFQRISGVTVIGLCDHSPSNVS